MTSVIEFEEFDRILSDTGITRISDVQAVEGEIDGEKVIAIIAPDVKKLLREAYMAGHSRQTNWEGHLEAINS